MLEHITKIRVRYGETDKMGFLYYGNYALYYEVGRVELIRTLGISYKNLEDMGILLPVLDMHVTFFRPAYYDDELRIRTRLNQFPEGSEIIFHAELRNEQDKILNTSEIKLAFVDASTMKKTRMPDILEEKLRPFFPDQP